MAKQTTTSPFRTVAGSYEAPVEGIVDYGAFGRGFEKGLGDLSKIKQEEDVDLGGLEQKLFKTGSSNKLLDGEEVNKDILGDKLLNDYARENSSLFRKGDTEAQKTYLQNLAKVQNSRGNRQTYWNRVGDSEMNDTNFNHNVIDENGKEIPGLTPAVINRIHKDPSFAKNRRIGVKDIIVNGESVGSVAGEYMTISIPDPTGKGGLLKMKEKEIFINYEDMNKEWQNKTFELNYSHESSLSKNKPKGFENKVVPGQMEEKKYDKKTIVNGKAIDAGSTRKIISDDWYNDTENKINLAANEVFNYDQGEMGDGYESAFRQFMDQDFELSPETIQKFKDQGLDITNANQIDKKLGANIKDAEKVNMLRDWWTQSSLITTASIGYDKDITKELNKKDYTNDEIKNGFAVRDNKTIELFEKDGKLFKKGTNRAVANPVKIDRRYKESPFEKSPPGDGDGGESSEVKGRLFNITSNLNNSVYNFSTPGQSSYLKGDGYKDINVKELTGGYFADIDGTKATLTSGRVVRDGNNMFLEIKYDVGRSVADGEKVVDNMTEQFPIARIEKDKNGNEKAVTDFSGRKRFSERIYKAQFGSSTADTATDLLTGDDTVYNDRTQVQKYFFQAGKDETMFRRLDIIRKFEENPNDPSVFDNLTEDDKKQLERARKKGTIGYKFQQAYVASRDLKPK